MSKIGILTFQQTVNYGAQFQNYALQEYIKSKQEQIETINYQNDSIIAVEKPSSIFRQKSLKRAIKFIKCHKYHESKWDKFEAFRKKYIYLTEPCVKRSIAKTCSEFDGIIVGSDQVWNTDITNNDYTYYLDFEKDNSKKYSYAASFGYSELPNKNKQSILSYLRQFQSINLREKSALNIIKSIDCNKNAVLDPTFLLDKEEWITKLGLKKDNGRKYIFVYMVDETKENLEKIYELAKKENLEIVHIRDGFKELKNIQSIRDASPQEFLNLLYNAKYTVVGSFHGLCLSLIFNKNFYYVLNNTHNRNSRLIDLLDIVNLLDRNNFKPKEIDYNVVNKKLEKNINDSKRILNSIIDSIEHESK